MNEVARDLRAQLNITEEEVEVIFSAIRDRETDTVSFELLSELVSKLEQVANGFFL